MKKTIALSLTLALAGAFTCLASNIPQKDYASFTTTCSVDDTQNTSPTKIAPINQDDDDINEKKTTPGSDNNVNNNAVNNSNNVNSIKDNGVNRINNGNLNNNTNNLATNNKGTSPYGINNGNAGVLPNQNNNLSTNLDSMVRTNNIDTYKNNTVTNIDGTTYNNNGVALNQNNNSNLNPNRQVSNYYKTNDIDDNVNQNSKTTAESFKKTNNDSLNTKNDSTDNTKSTRNTTKSLKSNYSKIDSTSLAELNSNLSNLNREMNDKMEIARENIEKVVDKTIELDDDKVDLLNAYSRVIHCLNIRLAENHFELMHAAGKLAVMQSEAESDSLLGPAYHEMTCTLRTREVCLECLIEALDELNNIFSANSDENYAQNYSKATAVSAKPKTKEYHLNYKPTMHEAHSTPRAKLA